MYLFRIHIRPGGGSAEMKTTFQYCLDEKLLGVGWRIEGPNTKDWDQYYREASKTHPDLNVCSYIHKWVSAGDLVWTRSPAPCQYYLACVKSGWEYWSSHEARDQDIDIANIFHCQILPVEVDAVPGKVVNSFRASRTIQEIADEAAFEYSKKLWNDLSKTNAYTIETSKFTDIFVMLRSRGDRRLTFSLSTDPGVVCCAKLQEGRHNELRVPDNQPKDRGTRLHAS